jgi:hypothetical protein
MRSIDDAYTDCYRSRHEKDVDCSLGLPVPKALPGHPEADALWEKLINKILDDLDIMHTTHKQSIYGGTINGKVVLLCRQVDDIAVFCSDPTMAQGFREFSAALQAAKIAKHLRPFSLSLISLHRGRQFCMKITRLPSTW